MAQLVLNQSQTSISTSVNLSSTIYHFLFYHQWLNQLVHRWSFPIVLRDFFACHSRNWSITLSINLSSAAWSITLSFTINDSIGQSINDLFTLFYVNSSPVIHELDQSKESIPLSVNLSCDLSHSLSWSMARSVSPSMILSHGAPRILRLSFTKSTHLSNRSLSHSRNRSHSLKGSKTQSLSPSMILSHHFPRIIRLSFTASIHLRTRSRYRCRNRSIYEFNHSSINLSSAI